MELKDIIKRSKEIQAGYNALNQKNGHQKWGATEYTQGLVGDVGDLVKLVMAKNNLRSGQKVDKKLEHELADCLWSIILIAEELGVDLEKSFMSTMDELENKLK